MDWNTGQCNNTAQFTNEKSENKTGDLERWGKSISSWIDMCGFLQGDS